MSPSLLLAENYPLRLRQFASCVIVFYFSLQFEVWPYCSQLVVRYKHWYCITITSLQRASGTHHLKTDTIIGSILRRRTLTMFASELHVIHSFVTPHNSQSSVLNPQSEDRLHWEPWCCPLARATFLRKGLNHCTWIVINIFQTSPLECWQSAVSPESEHTLQVLFNLHA